MPTTNSFAFPYRLMKLYSRSIALLLLLLGINLSQAQDAPENPEDRVLTTVGTSIAATEGTTWTYLLWTTETPHLLDGHGFAVFRKDGLAASDAPYKLVGLVHRQANTTIMRKLLVAGLGLGENLDALEMGLDGMFGGVASLDPLTQSHPDQTERVIAKLRYLIQQSADHPRTYRNLQLLSRSHPFVSLCLGQAFATEEKAGGAVTYEVRLCPLGTTDPATQCQDVIGRVSLVAGEPALLPAPGIPRAAPIHDAQGHLNVKLRWGIPNTLRERIVLHYGYHVYRVEKAFAEKESVMWHQTPPTPVNGDYWPRLAMLYPEVERVNAVPILPDRLISDLEALEGGPDLYFVVDDNDRFDEGQEPFRDQDEFYYFVTARDLLGRDGYSSAAGLVKICDRLPPPAPLGLQARSVYDPGQERQVLEIGFDQFDNHASATESVRRYHLYRWATREGIREEGDGEHRIATLDHIDGQARLRFRDVGDASPQTPGEVVWYTVRAEDTADCGPEGSGNLSGHSGPVSAVIRDRSTPEAPTGVVLLHCLSPVTEPDGDVHASEDDAAPLQDSMFPYRLTCRKVNPADAIDWVEFYQGKGSPETFVARASFAGGDVSLDVDLPKGDRHVFARVHAHGKLSAFSEAQAISPSPQGIRLIVPFKARLLSGMEPYGDDCFIHFPTPDDGLFVNLIPSEHASEIRVYMRVDNGPLQLVAQRALADDSPLQIHIETVPRYAESLCLYSQIYDANGNPSPLVQLACLSVSSQLVLEAPLLSAPQAGGDLANPLADLQWFCPSPGADRFRVTMGILEDAHPLPLSISGSLSNSNADISPGPSPEFTETFRSYDTGRISGSFPSIGDELYQVTVGVRPNVTYLYMVQAISPNGEEGPVSNVHRFTWTPPAAIYDACAAPLAWPHHQVEANYFRWEQSLAANPPDDRMTLQQHDDPRIGGGVVLKVGRYDWSRLTKGADMPEFSQFPMPVTPNTGDTPYDAYILPGHAPPESYFFEEDLFPFVLYRYQLPGDLYETVGGDLYQVTPLLESVTHEQRDDDTLFAGQKIVIYDPHVFMEMDRLAGEIDLFVRDTQPVIRGARYRYLMVQFDERHEIKRVRSLGTLTIQ